MSCFKLIVFFVSLLSWVLLQVGVGIELPHTLMLEAQCAKTVSETRRHRRSAPPPPQPKSKSAMPRREGRIDGADSGSGSDLDDNDENDVDIFGKVLAMDESAQVAPCQIDLFINALARTGWQDNPEVSDSGKQVSLGPLLEARRWRCSGEVEIEPGFVTSSHIPDELREELDDSMASGSPVTRKRGRPARGRLSMERDKEEVNTHAEDCQRYLESTLPDQTLPELALKDYLAIGSKYLNFTAADVAFARYVYELVESAGWQGLAMDTIADLQVSVEVEHHILFLSVFLSV